MLMGAKEVEKLDGDFHGHCRQWQALRLELTQKSQSQLEGRVSDGYQ